MRISARQKGGLFGGDREVTVDEEGRLRIRESDGRDRGKALGARDLERLRGLAENVTRGGDYLEKSAGAVDGGTTELEVEIDGAESRIRIGLGESVPDPVWALLDAMDSLSQ